MSIAHSPFHHHPFAFFLQGMINGLCKYYTVCIPWQLEHNYLKISPPKQIQTKFCEGRKQRFFWKKKFEPCSHFIGICHFHWQVPQSLRDLLTHLLHHTFRSFKTCSQQEHTTWKISIRERKRERAYDEEKNWSKECRNQHPPMCTMKDDE
jgi:hypothetical protein